MSINKIMKLSTPTSPDDTQAYVIRRDFSGGVNSRQDDNMVGENQATVLYNVDIGTVGETSKRPGSTLIGNDLGSNTIVDLHNYERQGYTDSLLAYENFNLWEWIGTGDWLSASSSCFASGATDVGMLSCKESGLVPDDIVIVQNGTDNPKRFHKDSAGTWAIQDLGTATGASGSPVKTTVMGWYGNRVWLLKNDLLYFSDAYDADYSTAFDTVTNTFRIPVGEERCVIPLRDKGMLIGGKNAIWGFFPSATPVATDRPEPYITGHGLVSKKGWCIAGDEIYYFAQDGLRAFTWTTDGTLTQKAVIPLSYNLKDEFASISWGYIERLSMGYFDNKIFIAVPTGATTFDTWVYYIAQNAFMVIQGWLPRDFATYRVGGEVRLYYPKHGDGTVYRAWFGYTDEGDTTTTGTAITYQEEGRGEDLGQPLVEKSGGEVKIKALATGNYTLTVQASFDKDDYVNLGTMSLAGGATLPVSLPFQLQGGKNTEKVFPIDAYSGWRTCKLKILHATANSSDEIKIFERSIISFPNPYQQEG
jgi:hypothetical protein